MRSGEHGSLSDALLVKGIAARGYIYASATSEPSSLEVVDTLEQSCVRLW